MYKAPFDIKDSQLYLDSLVIAKKNGPTIKTGTLYYKDNGYCNEWDREFFRMLDEQAKLYSVGKGRLQVGN